MKKTRTWFSRTFISRSEKKKGKNQKNILPFQKVPIDIGEKYIKNSSTLEKKKVEKSKEYSTISKSGNGEKPSFFFCWRSFLMKSKAPDPVFFVEVEVLNISQKLQIWRSMVGKKSEKSIFYNFEKNTTRKKFFPNAWKNISTSGNSPRSGIFYNFQKKVVKIHDRKKSEKK